MTQVCPVFGVVPVPTLLSSIFKPDAVVVMVLPDFCAAAGVVAPAASRVAPASATESAHIGARRKARIVVLPRRSRERAACVLSFCPRRYVPSSSRARVISRRSEAESRPRHDWRIMPSQACSSDRPSGSSS